MLDPKLRTKIRENWTDIQSQVATAAVLSGRDADAVRVIGVTKYVDAETTAGVVEAGCQDIGESRPQVLWEKAEQLDGLSTIRWHLIGHLQRNKVRRVLRHSVLIHSIDSQRILDAVASEARLQEQEVSVLLETNISGDPSKTGLSPDEIRRMFDRLPGDGVNIIGLMSMAGLGADSKSAQSQFAKTRSLRDELACRVGLELPELSMGMSGDFREAIAEGATMVRIGSRIFQ